MVTTKSSATTLAPKPAQTNGSDSKIPSAKLPMIVSEKNEDAKSEIKNNLPAIEARLKKLNEINELAERREVVKEAIQNLSGFYISPDGAGCNLRLQDSKGKTFAIAHPSVIGEMVALSKEKLSTELTRIENLIDFTI